MKAVTIFVLATLALSACGNTGNTTEQAPPKVEETGIPVPVLRIGQPAAIDLMGDGHATITVAATELSKVDDGSDRLVVTIDILLDKAGKPITGGPENFRFRDKGAVLHKALTDDLQPLPSVNFTTAGQTTHGRLYFDVPAGSTPGGYIQLMTGALVHAVWQL